MGIKIILQTVDGKREDEVVDSDYSLAKVWPVEDPSFSLLQYIDPYGNAIFNRQQMRELQKELEILITRASTDEQKDVIRRIVALATKCQQHPHLFLRFRGD